MTGVQTCALPIYAVEVMGGQPCHCLAGPRETGRGLRPGTVAAKRTVAGASQPLARCRVHSIRAGIKMADDAARQFVVGLVHGSIPCFASITERACVALEQCVFTLLTEQPMIFATSATSSSSQ